MIRPAAPILGRLPNDERARDRERGRSQIWRAWYKTPDWRRLRLDTFRRDGFTCQMTGCGRVEGNLGRLVCDHVRPHRGDRALFFEPTNLQTLCKPCHDSRKQAEERRAQARGL